MGHVHLSGHMQATLDRVEAVKAALPEHIRLTRAEPGCLKFEVWQDETDPARFEVSEIFSDRAAFDAHQARAGASDWARITAGLPRHYTVTEKD